MDGHSTSLAVARGDQPKKKFVHATDSSRALATQNPRTVQFGKKLYFLIHYSILSPFTTLLRMRGFHFVSNFGSLVQMIASSSYISSRQDLEFFLRQFSVDR